MAPSFDPRSIAGYAPIMTDVTEALLAKWDALPAPREADVAAAMMHATLHIISRAMFSSDSDEIVDVVEAGVNLYQSKVRPSLPDLLHLPKWLPRLFAPFPTGIFNEFDKKVDRLLTERGRLPDEPKDLLARLISARDAETGGGMTPKEVRDQVVTIFMAGHERRRRRCPGRSICCRKTRPPKRSCTTSSPSCWPAARRATTLTKLPYTRMVIEESMRLYPPRTLSGASRSRTTKCWVSSRRAPTR